MERNQSPPMPEGFSGGQPAASAAELQTHALRVGRAGSLKELEQEYGFFTPALLYLRVRLAGIDPLQTFIREYGKAAAAFTLNFDRPVFRGLAYGGNTYWNHHLMAVQREHWLPLMHWARSVAFLDPKTQLLTRVRPMLVTLADPLFLARASVLPSQLPVVDVGVLALDTSQGGVWIEEGATPAELPGVVLSGEAFRDTLVFADAVFKNENNPWRKVEEDRLDASLGLSPSEAWLLEHYRNESPAQPTGRQDLSQLPESEQREIRELLRFYSQAEGEPQ